MILSTMNDLPGYEVTEVIGEVFGITVRSRNVGSQIGAGLKSLVGGELRGMTKLLSASRTEAQDRLIEVGTAKGADAILAMRFDVSDLGNLGQEICAYGTRGQDPPRGLAHAAGHGAGVAFDHQLMPEPAGIVAGGQAGPGEQPGDDPVAFGWEVDGPVGTPLAAQHGRYFLSGDRAEGEPGGNDIAHPDLSRNC